METQYLRDWLTNNEWDNSAAEFCIANFGAKHEYVRMGYSIKARNTVHVTTIFKVGKAEIKDIGIYVQHLNELSRTLDLIHSLLVQCEEKPYDTRQWSIPNVDLFNWLSITLDGKGEKTQRLLLTAGTKSAFFSGTVQEIIDTVLTLKDMTDKHLELANKVYVSWK